MNMKIVGILLLVSTVAWAETPEWVNHPGRQVIAGDIVHWGTGDAATPDVAVFKARHMAIKTLMEECGGVASKDIIPRKQYVESEPGYYRAFALVSIEFDSCDRAKGPRGKRFENPEIVEDQRLYQRLVFGNSEDQARALQEIERSIKDDTFEKAAATEAQIQRLKNDVALLRAQVENPVQPARLPSSSSMKLACKTQLRGMASRLTQHAAQYHGNMADPGLNNELGMAMDQRDLCERMQ
jgi:hypothetical protein